MALTTEQIGAAKAVVFRECGADLRPEVAEVFASAIAAEVRKQDDALIQQMQEALGDGHDFAIECIHRFAEAMNGHRKDQLTKLEQEAERIAQAITAARARLGEKT